MKAVIVRVGETPQVVELPDDGEKAFLEMRKIVDGYLERVKFPKYDVYCVRVGNPKHLPQNRRHLVGTFIVLAPSPQWLVGLTEHEAAEAVEFFALANP